MKSEACGDYDPLATSALEGSCSTIPDCYHNNYVFYAKDYGYVGGHSLGTTEEGIMREIYENGPLAMSINVAAASPGFYWGNGGKTQTRFQNDKNVKEDVPWENMTSWFYTTHAIICVGFGEERVAPSGNWLKYWVIRNSWGLDWGDEGYAQLRRGHNDAAVEYESEWVLPNLSRLPNGFIERARRKFPTKWGYETHGKLRVVQPAEVKWR